MPGVRLWLAELDEATAATAGDWLSPSEQARAARFAFARDARRYRAAHTHLRHLLRQASGLARTAELGIGAQGKPHLPAASSVVFNLSHSDDWALIAIGGTGELGVDIELLRPMRDVETLAEHNLSKRERRALDCLPGPDTARAFLTAWTRKEACLKAVGCGLDIAPNTFDVGLTSEPRSVTLATDADTFEIRVQSIELGCDAVAALAIVQRSTLRG